VDFQINGLGTDKHVEAVLLHLRKKERKAFGEAGKDGSGRVDVVPCGTGLRVERNHHLLPETLKGFVAFDGLIDDPERFLDAAKKSRSPKLRISQEVGSWLESRRREAERALLRREYEGRVVSGEYPAHETKLPLYPYQREGMLHLAFTERALLADEMGLGKTIQAVAACALLHRMGKAQRVLVVSPASLKAEWEEQIAKFTDLGSQIVFGIPEKRWRIYEEGPFFTLVNYEQVMRDFDEINHRMKPDVVVLDEAQRIKNWSTKTAQAIKKLQSRYAFVLTGTPIENRIDDLYSIVNFIDPARLGSLFRFNREYYHFDDRGRPADYKNLDRLHERIRSLMVRRRKADVETELPDRTDKTLFVAMTRQQTKFYKQHENQVSWLLHQAEKRPLKKEELERLQRELAMMRMVCDTPYILDPKHKDCPKLDEIISLLDELLADPDTKIVIFSEWVKMLGLIREYCKEQEIGTVWHTGSVPQQKRRVEINRFKTDPEARIFLSSDSGGVGLNLQNASAVINCDLPWNPAKLEQRIARVWRKHQTRPVTVINLVAEKTIEHRMLETLANKQGLADAVLDRSIDFADVKMKSGGQAFFERLGKLMEPPAPAPRPEKIPEAEQPAAFADRLAAELGDSLLACEERTANGQTKLVITIDGNPAQIKERIDAIATDLFDSPHDIEILDRQTAETLQRLIDSGLLQQTGQTKPLYPTPEPPQLSEKTKARMAELKVDVERNLSMGALLQENGFPDGAIAPLQQAIRNLTVFRTLEKGDPEQKKPEEDFSNIWEQPVPEFMLNPTSEQVPRIAEIIKTTFSQSV
ncbi:MAG: DEAD/DEAH box helicase, partial [Verrucomicrobiota bacterium]|nr:DEAD/DEAH box helicase [Verrucomicrobiota bacterium]